MHTEGTRVLVVSRSPELERHLRKESDVDMLEVGFAGDVEVLSLASAAELPDAIVWDLSAALPEGFAVDRVVRHGASAPVLILRDLRGRSGRQLPRPGDAVSAGISAIERRVSRALGRRSHQCSWLPLSFSGVHLTASLPNDCVSVDGQAVSISPREGEILGFLLANCNRLVRREVLMTEIWGFPTRSLDVLVRRLRQKLGQAGRQLETAKAFGYRFVEPGPAPASAP